MGFKRPRPSNLRVICIGCEREKLSGCGIGQLIRSQPQRAPAAVHSPRRQRRLASGEIWAKVESVTLSVTLVTLRFFLASRGDQVW